MKESKNKCKYFLSIDNGLSVGKIALVDLDGNIIGISSFKNELINDGCFSELDMELLYNKTANVIKELIKNTGVNPSNIISVGNSGHGGGIYLLDNCGKPVRNAISSMDCRAEELISEWFKKGIDCYTKTYTHLWSGQIIPILYWLKENETTSFEKISMILFCKDWIKFKLTEKYSTDYTDASNGGVINLLTKNYDNSLYELYDIGEIYDKLPRIYRSEDVFGFISSKAAEETGLLEGIPVVSGIVDFVACMLGSGIYNSNAYSVVSGTWSINSAVKSELTLSPEIMGTVIFPDNKRFLAMDTSPTSAVNLEWFLSEILEKIGLKMNRKQIYKRIDEEIKKINISQANLLYFPFIYRSKLVDKMRGVFFGFDASDDIYDFIYSIYEGVVFAHLMHINNLRKGGVDCKKVVISGGAANSHLWCQIFADILNMEVITTSTKEVGILGLAIIQAVGMGIYKDLKEAIKNMVKVKCVYNPDRAKAEIYSKRFKEYERIISLVEK
jgi:L-xylulokinase